MMTPLVSVAAWTTNPLAIRSAVSKLFSLRMALGARSITERHHLRVSAAPNVLTNTDDFQMFDIDAISLLAKVVKDHALRQRSLLLDIESEVNTFLCFTIATIRVAVALPSLPNPARRRVTPVLFCPQRATSISPHLLPRLMSQNPACVLTPNQSEFVARGFGYRSDAATAALTQAGRIWQLNPTALVRESLAHRAWLATCRATLDDGGATYRAKLGRILGHFLESSHDSGCVKPGACPALPGILIVPKTPATTPFLRAAA